MSLLLYRPPLVTYRVVKSRRMTAYQAQYLARKSRQLGRGDGGWPDGDVALPIQWRAFRVVALAALSVGALLVLGALALLTWLTVELVAAIF
jgi:hypothetical protein